MSQTLKPLTAAQKLGIHLPAAPEEFRRGALTRDDLDALRADPPPWLVELRRNGPFPREVVAQKLGVSRAALSRQGVPDGLDAEQVGELLAEPPEWLLRERRTHTEAVAEQERARQRAAHPGS